MLRSRCVMPVRTGDCLGGEGGQSADTGDRCITLRCAPAHETCRQIKAEAGVPGTQWTDLDTRQQVVHGANGPPVSADKMPVGTALGAAPTSGSGCAGGRVSMVNRTAAHSHPVCPRLCHNAAPGTTCAGKLVAFSEDKRGTG